jgi:tRNA(Arg) A34 adenosine deaminase TadA
MQSETRSTTVMDETWLRRAFVLAETAVAAGDQAFGSLLVDAHGSVLLEAGNEVVASGDRTAHAELLICRRASVLWSREALAGSTLYTSTEPCVMCTGAIAWSGVNRLVFGISQAQMNAVFTHGRPRFSVPQSCAHLLKDVQPPLEVVGPLLEDEGARAHALWESLHPGE